MRWRVAERLRFRSVEEMEDELSPETIRGWMALAIHDQWGEEWKRVCEANGVDFDKAKRRPANLERAYRG